MRVVIAICIICSLNFSAHSKERLKVVASFSILADFAENVGGEFVSVTSLVGRDGDTHNFQPKPAHAIALTKADIVLINGLALEGFLKRLVGASGASDKIVKASQGGMFLGIDPHEVSAHGHKHGSVKHASTESVMDPHAWQSVRNALIYVKNIEIAFCRSDPANCREYQRNGAAYQLDLKNLDSEIRTMLEEIPANRRNIMTSHAAFNYFGQDYGLNFFAPQGRSANADTSARAMATLIRQIRRNNISALFLENVSNSRLLDQIARETGLKVQGRLYSDALSSPAGDAPTYIQMMRYNIQTIRNAILAP
ncbi:MAG: metal ABC transporter solute-binding protein, Zn/Mn family [Methyloligellaceae bacterium]